jgi:hypothetical protein
VVEESAVSDFFLNAKSLAELYSCSTVLAASFFVSQIEFKIILKLDLKLSAVLLFYCSTSLEVYCCSTFACF